MRLVSILLIGFVLASAGKVFAETFTYELYAIESAGLRLLAKGQKEYTVRDTVVTRQDAGGREYLQKELPLGNGFVVGVSDHGDPELTGFGCWLRRQPSPMEADPYRGFSWEWFNRTNADMFEKLQGGGSVRVTTKNFGADRLIERIEFLDDVEFRMNADRNGRPGTETHNMKIRKGSVLTFPAQAPPKTEKSALSGRGDAAMPNNTFERTAGHRAVGWLGRRQAAAWPAAQLGR